jgi:hypothetical protein
VEPRIAIERVEFDTGNTKPTMFGHGEEKRTMHHSKRMTASAACALAVAAMAAWAGGGATPSKVVGSDACKECHTAEHAAWFNTHHAKSFDALREGQEIADKLQLGRTFRRDGFCIDCHSTAQVKEDKATPISGVSCESCHGAAADWIKVHNDYGGEKVTREQESAEHRAARWKQAEAGGMLRPGRIDLVAGNCFSCHSVPHEQLVNVGGHKIGSDFELVSWSEGEVRHNYLASKGQSNAAASPERRRVKYVVGKLKDLEAGLRGMAKITDAAGAYATSFRDRTKNAVAALTAINTKQPIPEIGEALGKLQGVSKDSAAGVADQIAPLAAKLAANDGKGWAAIDALIPGEAKGTAP